MKHSQRVPEAILARIWEEQRFQSDTLKTLTGLPIRVIRRGRKNTDNGPDFRHALIRIGDQMYEGDVELHLDMGDWFIHGHATDRSYNQTILHVVLWPPTRLTGHSFIYKANGEHVPTAIVDSCLSAPLEKLLDCFQRTDQNKQQKIRHCQRTLRDIPLKQILSSLQQLGVKRLYERAHRFEAWLQYDSLQQILYKAICEGLGYTSNKQPFLELAQRLPLARILSHLPEEPYNEPAHQIHWIQALLFGAAGLLPASEEAHGGQCLLCKDSDPETIEYLIELRSLWNMLLPCLDLKPMKREDWHFFRLRPPNFPTRRIAALSYLILSYMRQPLFESYLQLFMLFSGHSENKKQHIRLLEHTLEVPATGYWKGRFLFGAALFPSHDRMFLGQSRIRNIIISAVFPVLLLYARQTLQTELELQILDLYHVFPSPPWNQMTKTIYTQLLNHKKGLLTNICTAVVYQGMLQLYKHFCYLPACANCPIWINEKII